MARTKSIEEQLNDAAEGIDQLDDDILFAEHNKRCKEHKAAKEGDKDLAFGKTIQTDAEIMRRFKSIKPYKDKYPDED